MALIETLIWLDSSLKVKIRLPNVFFIKLMNNDFFTVFINLMAKNEILKVKKSKKCFKKRKTNFVRKKKF